MNLDGERKEELLCWQGQAAIFWTGLEVSRSTGNRRSDLEDNLLNYIVKRRYQTTTSEDAEDCVCSSNF
jgi:hypothetical protein